MNIVRTILQVVEKVTVKCQPPRARSSWLHICVGPPTLEECAEFGKIGELIR